MIAVSSDEELVQALLHGRINGMVRLYVQRVGDDNSSSSESPSHGCKFVIASSSSYTPES